MKKIFISLACAVICCACDARRNNTVTDEQKNIQTEAKADANTEATANVNEARKSAADDQMAPDFTLNDINGKPLALSSLRGKYVIIDFWGTWCIWCVRGMPKMKEYYKKYSDKMEILGVDCNDPEKKWKAAVKELDLPWKHVYNPKDATEVLEKYEVQGFPTKVLVDPEGKLVKIVVGEDPNFYKYLDELFGK